MIYTEGGGTIIFMRYWWVYIVKSSRTVIVRASILSFVVLVCNMSQSKKDETFCINPSVLTHVSRTIQAFFGDNKCESRRGCTNKIGAMDTCVTTTVLEVAVNSRILGAPEPIIVRACASSYMDVVADYFMFIHYI